MVHGSGFSVQGSVFSVQGSGFMFQSSTLSSQPEILIPKPESRGGKTGHGFSVDNPYGKREAGDKRQFSSESAGLLQGPTGGLFLVSELPLYRGAARERRVREGRSAGTRMCCKDERRGDHACQGGYGSA